MATLYPVSFQDMDATRGTSTQALNSPSHVTHHALEDDTLEALQTKLGFDSSVVVTSIDYILKNTASFNPGHFHTALKPSANSTTALQLQNAAGTSILNVDTTNSRVGIGTVAPGTTFSVIGTTYLGSTVDDGLFIQTVGGLAEIIGLDETAAAYNNIGIRCQGGTQLYLTTTGNIGIGTTTFGTNAAGVLSIANGTAPTTGPADTVQFYSSDNAAGHTIPSFFTEGTDVLATGQADSVSSVRVKMRINGTVVTLLAI